MGCCLALFPQASLLTSEAPAVCLCEVHVRRRVQALAQTIGATVDKAIQWTHPLKNRREPRAVTMMSATVTRKLGVKHFMIGVPQDDITRLSGINYDQ